VDWTNPGWLAEAHEWIEAELARLGLVASAAIEQLHVRPWSTVLRVPTERGDVWFKANAPALEYEAAVVSLLSERRPDCVPKPLAVDLERGWILMEDAGERLREIVERDRDLDCWLEIMPLYAGVQIDLMSDSEELIARGAPDLRLATLAARYEELVDELGDAGPEAELDRLRAEVPRVAALCAELAGYGIPETIQHDDFHDGQVFRRDGRYLLLDWGDSCVSHPFFALSVTLEGVLAWGLDDIEGSLDTTPFRDAYLRPFERDFGDRDLVAATEIALRLGWVCRAVNGRLGDSDVENTLVRLRMFLQVG